MLIRYICVQNIFEQTTGEVHEIIENVFKKVRFLCSKKTTFCHFLKEQAECCLDEVALYFDIC